MRNSWKSKTLLGLALIACAAAPAWSQDESTYQRLIATLHVHSLISPHGKYSLQSIVTSAKKRGIDVLIPTDHFLQRWEYGVAPLSGILRTSMVKTCVYTFGPANYLHILKKLQQENPSMLIIPGLEVSPANYWTGHLFEGNMILHETQRHMLVMGMTDPGDIKRLPVLGNPDAGTFQWKLLVLPTLVVCIGLVLMIRWPAGLLLVAIGILWGFNQRPLFRISPAYDQYTRNGYDAAQNLIDYATAHGALTVWAHPEADNLVEPRKMYRSVSVQTVPYPEAVVQTDRFTGFAYFWEGEKVIGPPGGLWDQSLAAYTKGERAYPIWAFGELDWVEDHGENFNLWSMENVLWVKERTQESVLEAFRMGRFYLFKNNINNGFVLDRWSISGATKTAISGEETAWDPQSVLTLETHLGSHAEYTEIEGEIIRNGQIWKKLKGNCPFAARVPVPEPAQGTKDFYRLVLRVYGGMVVSNPIFVKAPADGSKAP